jgi:hypothetical protein
VGLLTGALDNGVRTLEGACGLAGVRVGRLGEDAGDLCAVRVLARGLFVGGDG